MCTHVCCECVHVVMKVYSVCMCVCACVGVCMCVGVAHGSHHFLSGVRLFHFQLLFVVRGQLFPL